jgi:hypothetical protein
MRFGARHADEEFCLVHDGCVLLRAIGEAEDQSTESRLVHVPPNLLDYVSRLVDGLKMLRLDSGCDYALSEAEAWGIRGPSGKGEAVVLQGHCR